jgi:hypothetical protein
MYISAYKYSYVFQLKLHFFYIMFAITKPVDFTY